MNEGKENSQALVAMPSDLPQGCARAQECNRRERRPSPRFGYAPRPETSRMLHVRILFVGEARERCAKGAKGAR